MPPEGRVAGGEGEPFGVWGKVFQALEMPVHGKTWKQFCCVGESAGAESGTEVRTVGGGECGRGCR